MKAEDNTAVEVAQWVVDNRYSKGEGQTVSDHEIFYRIKDAIEAAQQSQQPSNVEGIESIERLIFEYQSEHGFHSTFDFILEHLEDLKASQLSGEWVSVDDRLPDEDGDVLCRSPHILGGNILIAANYEHESMSWHDYMGNAIINAVFPITHWMPLPTPPKEKG